MTSLCDQFKIGANPSSSHAMGPMRAAADFAMNLNPGMICDSIGGLVKIPCIERNAMRAVEAVPAFARRAQ